MMDVPILVGKSVGTKIGAVIEDWVMMGKRPAIQNRNHGQIIEERIKTDDVLNMENPVAISSKMNVYGFSILELLSPLCFMKQSAFEKIDKLKNLGPVLEYMRRNFDKPLDRDELARIACLSPAQFHVVFKDTVGVTPIRFLMGIRFRHAQHLLLRTSLTVLEVAARCGYDDVFVFSKFFKRLCKISPRDYRIAGSRT